MPTIYQAQSMGDANVRVALVERGKADLLVHRVGSRGLAHGEARWFVTRNKQDADLYVFFTSEGMAQLKVCFVDTYGEAGWQGPRPPGVRLA